MKIVIDLDDVVFDWTNGFAKYINANLNTSLRIREVMGWTLDEEVCKIKMFNTSSRFSELDYKENAIDVVRKLANNNSISFVSSCGNSLLTRMFREHNLSLLNISYNLILLDIHEIKWNVFDKIKPDIIIDDNFDNVSYFKYNNINGKGVLFDAPWSRLKDKTYTWKDIENEFSHIV